MEISNSRLAEVAECRGVPSTFGFRLQTAFIDAHLDALSPALQRSHDPTNPAAYDDSCDPSSLVTLYVWGGNTLTGIISHG